MKAIAEYFRDLASEDRYFGAEPPTPDAAMLHRIAEREIQRRVEARIEDNGVVLRAGDQMPSVQIAPQAMPQTVVPAVAAFVAAPESEPESVGESVADKLGRLRAEQAAAALPLAANDDMLPVETVEATEAAPDLSELDDLPAEFAASLDELPPEAPADVAAAFDAAQDDDLLAFVAAETLDAADETVSDAVAEPETDPAPVADLDDSFADDGFDDAGFDMAAFAADAFSAPQDDEADDLADLATLDGDIADGDDSLLASLGAMIDPEGDLALDEDQPELDHLPERDDASDLADDLPELEDIDETDSFAAPAVAAVADDLAAPVVVETAETAEAAMADPVLADPVVADPVVADPLVADESNHRLQRARARVIKIRRTEPAIEAAPAMTPAPSAASLLSAEAEAELQRELAELEAEEMPALAAAVATAITAPVATDRLQELDETVAVDRLMAQTQTAMEVPENKRRLSAIAHLKAAVAATVADRKVNPAGPANEDRTDAYRDDLNRVVRPRRPGAPTGDRPAPLVLVSEQRIDRARPAPLPEPAALTATHTAAPIRPRRVRAGALAVQSLPAAMAEAATDQDEIAAQLADEMDADEIGNIFASSPDMGFSDFAERLGADSMADLLEAAGAYCALVLERPQFSRPLLLAQLSRLPEADSFSREDSLRGFGTLLREGRITKIKRGQFMLPEGSRALADAKRIAR